MTINIISTQYTVEKPGWRTLSRYLSEEDKHTTLLRVNPAQAKFRIKDLL